MASTQTLSAASQDRKARLAQLKSLKRKQPSTDADRDNEDGASDLHTASLEASNEDVHRAKSPRHETEPVTSADVTSKYLSGRNYDAATKNAKLGFENDPSLNGATTTLERRAEEIAAATQRQAAEEEKGNGEGDGDKPLDLFALQPKKANWDLKRDMERKLEVLNVRTDNALARLVRERIAKQQEKAKSSAGAGNAKGGQEGEAIGLEGATLVEATNVREREDEEEARREREEEDALLNGS